MMRCLTIAVLVLPVPALAGDVSLGALVGTSLDLPDAASGDHTRFGPGGSLSIPLHVELAPYAFFRATLRADASTGHDRVSWAAVAGERDVRLSSADHWAMLTAAALTVGVEGRLPGEDLPVVPLAGFGVGGAWVGTWHSFGVAESGADTTLLLDPAENDLSDPNNIDPYATNLALLVDVYGGAAIPLTDSLDGVVEIGYSVAFLPGEELQKATPGLDAQRDAFGWNALRLQAGVSITF